VLEIRRNFQVLALLHQRADLAPDPAIRFWPVHGYLIGYLPDTHPLSIARILHGARDPEELRTELGRREDDG
jgi:plasmid stabilization system protein ParE